MSGERPAFSRLLQLLAGPPIVIGLLVFFILSADFASRSSKQQQYFGQSTAAQLSEFVVHYVVTNDILSLNVISAKVSGNGQVNSVAIYNESDDLIAQSGRDDGKAKFFTKEITFQDSVIGYLRISIPDESLVNHSLLIVPAALLSALILTAWFRTEWIISWLYPRILAPTDNEKDTLSKSKIAEKIEVAPECFLVVRIRPAQHLARHFAQFFDAAELFKGVVEQTTPEELIIHFEGEDSMFAAASTGVLIQQLSKILQGNMTFGGILDLAGEDSDKRRKAASYLASIANDDLIIARGKALLADRATLQTFHHSLVDSDDLKLVATLENEDELLKRASILSKA